jgi:hypothetical protein
MSTKSQENMEPTNTDGKKDTASDQGTKRSPEDDTNPEVKRTRPDEEILDLANVLRLRSGDRLEVQWEICTNDEQEDQENPVVHWWGATLLEHDGRTEDSVAIRTLEYDAYPEGGFPEKSREDVIFMGRDVLVTFPSQQELTFRAVSDDNSELVWVGLDQVDTLVNNILTSALEKTQFKKLPHAQQAFLAEKIAAKKEKLVVLLQNHMQQNRLVTVQDATTLLARTMTDDE